MNKPNNKDSQPAVKLILWIARTLSILSILIVLLFILGEGFNPFTFTANELLLAVFFPVLTTVGLIVAWKKSLLGGILSLTGLVLFYVMNYFIAGKFPKGWAFFMFNLPAILFVAANIVSGKNMIKNKS